MFKSFMFLLLLFFCPASGVEAQGGFFIPEGQRQMDIPFEYTNNFIILTVTFNGLLPLKFIFDTGAEHTILSKREISDMLNVTYEREFRVTGSDLKTELVAYLARRVRFDIPEKAAAPSVDILVLQEDYFRFEEYAGVNVHGIMAANAFSKYIIKINYDRKVMTLYDRAYFKVREAGYEAVPVEIFRNKIYLKTNLKIVPDSVAPVKLLLDTGAGLPLLLFSDTHPLLHPSANAISSNIGMGLGGYLEGFTGRIHHVEIGAFSQQNVITYFQTLDTVYNAEHLNKRNGLIGNTLLSRFYVILDYQTATIWLKPARNFKSEFVYDRSGLNIIASGANFNRFTVQSVLPNSPAAEADFRKGDEIVRVGWLPTSFSSLADLQHTFQKKAGKKLKVVIRRDGKLIKKRIVLRDLI
ncbi:MAG: PDZ domain-containing protein [Haliscomenobacteraceae bacterium CHB4]|nr:hypothetical protein [Saprospiraceae bacterium]MCE7923249.1 PDZ domain-containing protein [Haliscomenobacteraceae bacterium CHB4]